MAVHLAALAGNGQLPACSVAGAVPYTDHVRWISPSWCQAGTGPRGSSHVPVIAYTASRAGAGDPGPHGLSPTAGLPAVFRDRVPVRWTGQRAVVTLPEHIDVANAGQIREELLSVINRGATELVADMTATGSCDHAGADAVARAYQRAAASGTQLRLVVPAPAVRRVLGINGLDRLIPIYPSLEAATAAASATVTPVVPTWAAPGHPARARRPRRPAGPGAASRLQPSPGPCCGISSMPSTTGSC